MNGFSADPTGAKISGISYATVSCTLQDDGVLGKKRTAPLQQADLVMLAFKFNMDDLQIIVVRSNQNKWEIYCTENKH
jgi:hypothetical protein